MFWNNSKQELETMNRNLLVQLESLYADREEFEKALPGWSYEQSSDIKKRLRSLNAQVHSLKRIVDGLNAQLADLYDEKAAWEEHYPGGVTVDFVRSLEEQLADLYEEKASNGSVAPAQVFEAPVHPQQARTSTAQQGSFDIGHALRSGGVTFHNCTVNIHTA